MSTPRHLLKRLLYLTSGCSALILIMASTQTLEPVVLQQAPVAEQHPGPRLRLHPDEAQINGCPAGQGLLWPEGLLLDVGSWRDVESRNPVRKFPKAAKGHRR